MEEVIYAVFRYLKLYFCYFPLYKHMIRLTLDYLNITNKFSYIQIHSLCYHVLFMPMSEFNLKKRNKIVYALTTQTFYITHINNLHDKSYKIWTSSCLALCLCVFVLNEISNKKFCLPPVFHGFKWSWTINDFIWILIFIIPTNQK